MQVTTSKVPGISAGQRLDRLQPVVDLQTGLEQVQLRDIDQLRRQVDGADLRALARQRLAEQAGAAADVEHARPGQPRRDRRRSPGAPD